MKATQEFKGVHKMLMQEFHSSMHPQQAFWLHPLPEGVIVLYAQDVP